MTQKKKISYVSYMRNKRELDALYALGYRYDVEKDPEKKQALEAEIIRRCDQLKPKLGLKDLSDEEARELLGVSAANSAAAEDTALGENQNVDTADGTGEDGSPAANTR